MNSTLLKQCLDILKTQDVRKEIKKIFTPVTELILLEIYPYIYIIIMLVFLIFVLIITIFIILVYMHYNILNINK